MRRGGGLRLEGEDDERLEVEEDERWEENEGIARGGGRKQGDRSYVHK